MRSFSSARKLHSQEMEKKKKKKKNSLKFVRFGNSLQQRIDGTATTNDKNGMIMAF